MASNPSPHDLSSFLIQETNRLAEEYQRLAPKVAEDPGTAGDQGEENWAGLLRKWLPATFHVVTKGRLLAADGKMSGQMDIFVLSPSYPVALLSSKHYLSAGVLAAFECKRTLRPEHVASAFKQSKRLKSTGGTRRIANAYNFLCSPPLYGFLAHAHSLKGKAASNQLTEMIDKVSARQDAVPANMPDLFCVANLGTWSISCQFGPVHLPNDPKPWVAKDAYVGYMGPNIIGGQMEHFTPIGSFLCQLYKKLAWREEALREFAAYFAEVGLSGYYSGNMRKVHAGELPDWFLEKIHHAASNAYDPWAHQFE